MFGHPLGLTRKYLFVSRVKFLLLHAEHNMCPSLSLSSRIESELTPLPEAFHPEALGVDKERIVHSPKVFRRVPVRCVSIMSCGLCCWMFISILYDKLTFATTFSLSSWDFFLENAMDPAHVQHAHHGTVGNRYEESFPYDTVVTKKASKNGFEMSIRYPGAPAYTDKFEAPGVFSINTPRECDFCVVRYILVFVCTNLYSLLTFVQLSLR